MFTSHHRTLARLSRWPRRIAALGCLLLAGASAVVPAGGRATPRRIASLGAQLNRDEVAMSVAVASAPSYLHRGDRIGLLAGPDESGSNLRSGILADRLRVLAVPPVDSSGTDPPTVLVAANRAAAIRIAATTGRPALVVVDRSP